VGVGFARSGGVEKASDQQRAKAGFRFKISNAYLFRHHLRMTTNIDRTYLIDLSVRNEVRGIDIPGRSEKKILHAVPARMF
jgi:hypothetical protein